MSTGVSIAYFEQLNTGWEGGIYYIHFDDQKKSCFSVLLSSTLIIRKLKEKWMEIWRKFVAGLSQEIKY